MIKNRLQALREQMRKRGIQIYMIPTADCHESEYVGDHFKSRVYMTGFTGSAGTAVITMEEAGLWTDGRYFIQAANQLKDSTIDLYCMGEEGVPTVEEFIGEHLTKGGLLGFDGSVVNTALGKKLSEIAKSKEADLYSSEDLVDLIWEDRPALSANPAWILEDIYAGESRIQKLSRLREKMKQLGADAHILSDLADIAWLFNIRGNDAAHFPIVLSFALITQKRAILFIQEKAVTEKVRQSLTGDGILLAPYEGIYSVGDWLSSGSRVLLDENRVNLSIFNALPTDVSVLNEKNPEQQMKAVKNETELSNLRKAHVKDGVAFTKFMFWLKQNVGKIPMDEITAAKYLEDRRKEQGCLDASFETICAYNANAAMMHYSAVPESAAKIHPEGFLLVDSGGHYLEGSTDITRTMALGPVQEEWRKHFTLVLRSMLNLASARFLYGCTGVALDILARGPLWQIGMDYKCGTGHGVGYLLNIHEGPNCFRWRSTPDRPADAVIEEGMVTTDEPGVYVEGSHGIRTENELICRKSIKNEYGQFMEFEHLTYAPIDLDAIIPELLLEEEKKALNAYHEMVFRILAPHLSQEERNWLKIYTRPI